CQVEMVQDRTTPDSLKGMIREGEAFAVGFDEIDVDAIGLCPAASFIQVAMGQVERRHAGAPPGQNDSRHAVSAAEIEHRHAPDLSQLLKSRAHPAFMIEISIIVENQRCRL